MITKHADIFWEIHGMRKGLWASFSWLYFSDADSLGKPFWTDLLDHEYSGVTDALRKRVTTFWSKQNNLTSARQNTATRHDSSDWPDSKEFLRTLLQVWGMLAERQWDVKVILAVILKAVTNYDRYMKRMTLVFFIHSALIWSLSYTHRFILNVRHQSFLIQLGKSSLPKLFRR